MEFPSEINHISALCLRERVHPLSKKIDGAVITSKAENNLDCTITFQTDTILQKFMLRFEKLALDCNDHLYIYDGAHTIGNHKADLSCRSTRAEVGTIYIQSNFLTLRYTTDAYSKADNGFRLIITAYKDSKNYCREHRCANQYCVSRDLVCDGVNHCGDNSDEHYYVHCQENEVTDTIIGLDPMMFIAIVSSIFVSCLACVISVAFCLCRRERLLIQQRQQQQQMALQQQQYQLHDTGHHMGTTPLMTAVHHHPNNNFNPIYQTKLDGVSLAAFGASNTTTVGGGGLITRNGGGGGGGGGGLVNSYTHTALPNNVNQNHFSTLPHHHHNHNHHQQQVMLPGQQQQQQGSPTQHVRFGTLPNRSGSISQNNNSKLSPQSTTYQMSNGNSVGLATVVTTATGNGGNGHVTTVPISSSIGLQQQQVHFSTANSS
ncbi:hypothetical protein HUG17_10550 [Dermatophagoides farinae]|uniref:CUB domain-containing protein n=1 Tax=Dermatophagoides farinae TaxID=6954 RepID=A0A9D4SD08_DERFA|nr:hypothetical protein HUG17_10550 [Dermatophagoides farinae]